MSPGQCGQLVGALSSRRKCHEFDSQSGYISGLLVQSLVREHGRGQPVDVSFFLSPFLPLSLKKKMKKCSQ